MPFEVSKSTHNDLHSIALNWHIAKRGILITQLLYLVYFSRNSYFWGDDFYNLISAHEGGLTTSFLSQDVGGQFAPGVRLIIIAYVNWFGLSFWPARSIEIVLACLTTLQLLLIAEKRGNSFLILTAATILLIFSPLYAGRLNWWASAVQILPSTVAAMGSILSFMSVAPKLARRQVVMSSALYLFGLLIYAKVLFVVVLLFSIRVFLLSERYPRISLLRLANRAFCDVIPHVSIAAIYLLIFKLGSYGSNVPFPLFKQLCEFVAIGWNEGFLVRATGVDFGFPAKFAVLNFVVVAIVGWSLFRTPRTGILWAGFFGYFVFGIASIGLNRVAMLGINSASAARYHSEALVYFLAISLLAFCRPACYISIKVAALKDYHAFLRVSFIALLLIVFAVHLAEASNRMRPSWYSELSTVKSFVKNVEQGLVGVSSSAKISDGPLPSYVLQSWAYPFNTYKNFATLFPIHATFVSDRTETHSFGADGRLQILQVPRP